LTTTKSHCDDGSANGVPLRFADSVVKHKEDWNLGRRSLIFEGIAKVGEESLALKVTPTSPYDAGDSDPRRPSSGNGKSGAFGKFTVPCSKSVDLRFNFQREKWELGSSKLSQFYLSFFFADAAQSIGIDGFDEYVVSPSTDLRISANTDADTGNCPSLRNCPSTWFSSTSPDSIDLPVNPSVLTQLQKDRAVTFSFTDASEFSITLDAGSCTGTRDFSFTGSSALVESCHPVTGTTTASPGMTTTKGDGSNGDGSVTTTKGGGSGGGGSGTMPPPCPTGPGIPRDPTQAPTDTPTPSPSEDRRRRRRSKQAVAADRRRRRSAAILQEIGKHEAASLREVAKHEGASLKEVSKH